MSDYRNIPVLALAIAFITATPTMLNLLGAILRDGDSFTIIAGGAVSILAIGLAAGITRGWPKSAITGINGFPLLFCCLAVVFWTNQFSLWLTGREDWDELIYTSVWLFVPATLAMLWRDHLDIRWLVRAMAICGAVYVMGVCVHYLLGGGHQHSGRWHAGDSLEAIRCGRYAVVALWLMVVVIADPDPQAPRMLRLVLLAATPFALLVMLVTNARGPWLAFIVALAVTGIPLWRMVWPQLAKDARLIALAGIVGLGAAAFLIIQLVGSETRFDRLFDSGKDGGSSASRLRLIDKHITLFNQSNWNLLYGTGYRHAFYYPHNIALEALVAGGLPHLFLLIGNLALGPITWLLGPKGSDPTSLALMGLWVIGLAGAMFSGSVAGENLPWHATLLLALHHHQRCNRLRNQPLPTPS